MRFSPESVDDKVVLKNYGSDKEGKTEARPEHVLQIREIKSES
jgi:hypothetical protein